MQKVRWERIVLMLIGVLSILSALFGLFYNANTLSIDFLGQLKNSTPYFYPFFYLMSTFCLLSNFVLLISGAQFIRLKIKYLNVFIIILNLEIIYFF